MTPPPPTHPTPPLSTVSNYFFFILGIDVELTPAVRYLVDAFTVYAASALAGNTVVRSIVGAVLPLCGLQMYEALGLGWGNSLLGFIAVALIPVPFFVMKKGEWLRTKYALKNL